MPRSRRPGGRLPHLTAAASALLLCLPALLGARLRRLEERGRGRDDGYSTEFMVITALLIAAAVIIVGIIAKKLKDKANGLNL